MDIVTHALMGTAIAGPVLATHPVTASCFILGSVLPDLDALSRVLGKRTFLRWHQTYTHGLPVIVGVALVVQWLLPAWADEPWAAVALAAGMTLHALLDVTNTYGTAILAPISRRRFCTEWVFFIDAPVIAVTALAAGVVVFGIWTHGRAPARVAVAYVAFLLVYWSVRAGLHRLARAHVPSSTRSVIPSALVPWHFLGYGRENERVVLFEVNALTGRVSRHDWRPIWDAQYEGILSSLPEFRLMRQISPAYHVVEAAAGTEGQRLVCRDLRTRNFGGSFGELIVTLDQAGQIRKVAFHA